jgi:hypothetical protein
MRRTNILMATIRRLRLGGYTAKEIAIRCKTTASTVGRIAFKKRLPKSPYRIKKDVLATIVMAANAGSSDRQIGDTVKKHRGTIHSIRKAFGITASRPPSKITQERLRAVRFCCQRGLAIEAISKCFRMDIARVRLIAKDIRGINNGRANRVIASSRSRVAWYPCVYCDGVKSNKYKLLCTKCATRLRRKAYRCKICGSTIDDLEIKSQSNRKQHFTSGRCATCYSRWRFYCYSDDLESVAVARSRIRRTIKELGQ